MIYAGWVYVLRNKCKYVSADLYKIGFTNEIDLNIRVNKLGSQTASPGKFDIIFAVWVNEARIFESYLHKLLSEQRIDSDKEFFYIPKDTFEWKSLIMAIDREVYHGGIIWREEHGKYNPCDLFGPFDPTEHNKLAITREEDVRLVDEINCDIDHPEDDEPVNIELPEMIENLTILESFESIVSNDTEVDDYTNKRKRSANKDYDVSKLCDGAIVETPIRLRWSRDPKVTGTEYSMKVRYNKKNETWEDLETKQTFQNLPEMCKRFITNLGWDDALRTNERFQHSPGKKTFVHTQNNHTIPWQITYLVEGTKKTMLKHII